MPPQTQRCARVLARPSCLLGSDTARFLSQAGARPVSQPPTPDQGSLSVMTINVSRWNLVRGPKSQFSGQVAPAHRRRKVSDDRWFLTIGGPLVTHHGGCNDTDNYY